jgi:hypothetical protein
VGTIFSDKPPPEMFVNSAKDNLPFPKETIKADAGSC